MMVDHCTQHEQKSLLHLWYITTNIQNLWYCGHKCYILIQNQSIFYMHQVSIVVDYCTKYEQNQPILLWALATNIFTKNIGIIAQFWHSQMIFYMHQQHLMPDYHNKYSLTPLIWTWNNWISILSRLQVEFLFL